MIQRIVVDEQTCPLGPKPVEKTEEMTQPVGMDESGALWTAPGDPGQKGDKGDPGEKGDKGDKGDPGAGLETVLPLIPEEASSENQLADKAYVNCMAARISTPGTVSADGPAVIPEGKNDPTSMTMYYPDPWAGLLVSQYHRMNALYFNNPYNRCPGGPEYTDGVTINYQKDGHCKMTGRRSGSAVKAFFDSKSTGATPILVKANTSVYIRDIQIWYVPALEMPENLKNLSGGTYVYGISTTDWQTSAPTVFTPTEDIYIVRAGLYIKMNVNYNDIYFPQLAIGYSASEVREEVYTDNWYYTLPAVYFDDVPNGRPAVAINYLENQVSVTREEPMTEETYTNISYAYNDALIHRPQSGQTVTIYSHNSRINDPEWSADDAAFFEIRYDEPITAVSFYQNHRKLLGIWTGDTYFVEGSRSFLNIEGFRRFEVVFQDGDCFFREIVEIGKPTMVHWHFNRWIVRSRTVTDVSENAISFSNGFQSSGSNDLFVSSSALVPIEIWGIQ